jgi:hypothetical protein
MPTRDAAQGGIVFFNGYFPKNVQTICQNDDPFTLANGPEGWRVQQGPHPQPPTAMPGSRKAEARGKKSPKPSVRPNESSLAVDGVRLERARSCRLYCGPRY